MDVEVYRKETLRLKKVAQMILYKNSKSKRYTLFVNYNMLVIKKKKERMCLHWSIWMHHFTRLEYLLLCLCFRGGVVTPISILQVSVCVCKIRNGNFGSSFLECHFQFALLKIPPSLPFVWPVVTGVCECTWDTPKLTGGAVLGVPGCRPMCVGFTPLLREGETFSRLQTYML